MITAKSIGTGGLGRMGNQMFTIAGCIGIAVKSGQPYAFPKWLTQDNALFGQSVDNINDYLLNPLPRIPEGLTFKDYGYFWGYKDINLLTGNWSIDAHLQSEKFFSHCIELIRKTFTFKDEPEQNDYVAIHYRAGDYQEGEDCHHPRCSKEYYEKAIEQFTSGTKFIVFSDNNDSWNEVFKTISPALSCQIALFARDQTYIESFKMMKSCKSFITANSSFSLMAAILGTHPEKKIICPSRWFGSSMPDLWKNNTKDIYPEGAIII